MSRMLAPGSAFAGVDADAGARIRGELTLPRIRGPASASLEPTADPGASIRDVVDAGAPIRDAAGDADLSAKSRVDLR